MEGKIYTAICGAMADIGAIGKKSKNAQQGFMYRGIDAIYNALQPVLIDHHIFVTPEVLEQTREERVTKSGSNLIYSILKVRFTFYADDGSSVSAVVTGEGMDSGDKASNKAMSVAFKYACFEVFCIPTEEMKDPDSETPPESTRTPKYIDDVKKSVLRKEAERIGWSIDGVVEWLDGRYSNAPGTIDRITVTQFLDAMKQMEGKPDGAAAHE